MAKIEKRNFLNSCQLLEQASHPFLANLCNVYAFVRRKFIWWHRYNKNNRFNIFASDAGNGNRKKRINDGARWKTSGTFPIWWVICIEHGWHSYIYMSSFWNLVRTIQKMVPICQSLLFPSSSTLKYMLTNRMPFHRELGNRKEGAKIAKMCFGGPCGTCSGDCESLRTKLYKSRILRLQRFLALSACRQFNSFHISVGSRSGANSCG